MKSSHFILLEIENDNMHTQKITEKGRNQVVFLLFICSLCKKVGQFIDNRSLRFVSWRKMCLRKLIMLKEKIQWMAH